MKSKEDIKTAVLNFLDRGPLTNVVTRSRTTTENCAMGNSPNWSVCLFMSLKKYPLLPDHQVDFQVPLVVRRPLVENLCIKTSSLYYHPSSQ